MKRCFPALLLLLILATLIPSPVRAEGALDDCSGVKVAAVNAAFEQEVVERVNAERGSQGLAPLQRAAGLDDAARAHAADMAQEGYFSHDSKNPGCTWSARVGRYYTGWSALSENIAAGQGSPADVVNAWMNSDGHRKNILSPDVREIGVGYAAGGPYGHYWVQDFGSRFSVYPLVINRAAAVTNSRGVSLYIYGAGAFNQIRLKDDLGNWTAWQPFTAELAWRLTPGVGLRMVTAELKTASGQVVTTSDTIQNTDATNNSALGGLPAEATFVYSTAEGRFLSPAQTFRPLNSGEPTIPLAWTVSTSGESWFSLAPSPAAGETPNAIFTVAASCPSCKAGDTRAGTLTVTVTSPGDAAGMKMVIDVRLIVVDTEFSVVMLPVVVR